MAEGRVGILQKMRHYFSSEMFTAIQYSPNRLFLFFQKKPSRNCANGRALTMGSERIKTLKIQQELCLPPLQQALTPRA